MSDTETKTRKAMPARDFTDQGTGRSFTTGVPVELPEGEFLNYHLANLVAEVVDEDPASVPAESDDAKTSRRGK